MNIVSGGPAALFQQCQHGLQHGWERCFAGAAALGAWNCSGFHFLIEWALLLYLPLHLPNRQVIVNTFCDISVDYFRDTISLSKMGRTIFMCPVCGEDTMDGLAHECDPSLTAKTCLDAKHDITRYFNDVKNGKVEADCICWDCNCQWVEVYKLDQLKE